MNEIPIGEVSPIAVIDTGIDISHEQFRENIYRNSGEVPGNGVDDDENGYIDDTIGWDFYEDDNMPHDNFTLRPKVEVNSFMDFLNNGRKWIADIFEMGQEGHGTHVSGIISKEISKAYILPLRIRVQNFLAFDMIYDALEYAISRNAAVVNLSLGKKVSQGEDTSVGILGRIETLITESPDTLFVIAAGNESANISDDPFFPALLNLPNVITVGALEVGDNEKRWISSYSNFSRGIVDIYANGTNIESAWPGNSVKSLSGTSMATPLVAARAYKIYLENPELRGQRLKRALFQRSSKFRFIHKKDESGENEFLTRVRVLK